MPYSYRDAREADLPRIVEIYNFAVATRKCSCDLDPTSVKARRPSFLKHTPDRRPFWVAEDTAKPGRGAIGYLGFFHFMNERPGYFITADIAVYLHPQYQSKGLGTFLLERAIEYSLSLGIETLTATEMPVYASFERPLLQQSFGAYELLEPLGQGGMGTVWKALHTKLGKNVALKFLPPQLLSSPAAVERFEREMRAIGRLQHPNIVQAFDAGVCQGTHVLAMEFIDGLNLQEFVETHGPQSVPDRPSCRSESEKRPDGW